MKKIFTLTLSIIAFSSFSQVLIKETNVNIEGGKFFSFLGPSGCGKTTILRAVSGFLEPSDGKVLIGGKDMKPLMFHNTDLLFPAYVSQH